MSTAQKQLHVLPGSALTKAAEFHPTDDEQRKSLSYALMAALEKYYDCVKKTG
jgi:hypothetical protein